MYEQFFRKGLHGKGIHVDTATVFDGLEWQKAGEKPGNCPHSVWELLFQMNYWQDYMLAILNSETPQHPEHAAESWPDSLSPVNEEEWNSAVAHFLKGIEAAEQEATKDLAEQVVAGNEKTRADCLLTIMLHNTYHAGQAVIVRKTIGAWPPPSGGDTW